MYNIRVRRIYLRNAETVFGFHAKSDEAQRISRATHTQRLLFFISVCFFLSVAVRTRSLRDEKKGHSF